MFISYLLIMSKVKIPRLGASPKASSKNVSKVMKANKASGTKIEVVFKDVLRREGLKNFTSNPKNVIGRPDKVFEFWEHDIKKNPDKLAKRILKYENLVRRG